ncbi:gamma-glutamylaminecyclotransferase [Inhella inkyongensis]|uniref:Gamma-glutamylcyclotransferase family protein n=1 Tax=Inhella inkyongensis TaxID=392593 RepID=A0A840SA11_9BURK|nr:gamma-glutamylcyclotransferase family protein [Inhella inkyongensis]MBB5206473.1 gamma-glutamylaminecyclotransferase [Inhella inkyongensis]
MSALIFTYGTLKAGFRNQHWNEGERVPGVFETLVPLPLYVIGPRHLPWLLELPGQGLRVQGELYRVDAAGLARMDELEQVDEPLWYRRAPLQVRGSDGRVWDCEVYFGCATRWAQEQVHLGPLAAYTQEHAAQRERALALGPTDSQKPRPPRRMHAEDGNSRD